MKKFIIYTSSAALIMVLVFAGAMPVRAVQQRVVSNNMTGNTPYGYYNTPYTGMCGSQGYGMSPYQQPLEYCVRWNPGHWVPVKVMVPGRWEYRRVWIRAYPTTLYHWVAGYYQTTYNNSNKPDFAVWGTQNGNWYGLPYQSAQQPNQGYFDQNGVWRQY